MTHGNQAEERTPSCGYAVSSLSSNTPMKNHASGIDAEALITRKNPSKENESNILIRKKHTTIPGNIQIAHIGGRRSVDRSIITNTVSCSIISPYTPLALLAQYN
jgi:hypothetical protein